MSLLMFGGSIHFHPEALWWGRHWEVGGGSGEEAQEASPRPVWAKHTLPGLLRWQVQCSPGGERRCGSRLTC